MPKGCINHTWILELECLNCFFFLISQNIYIKKAQRGATQSTQEVYKGKPKKGGRSDKENLKN
jgi:hypothetical protein